MSNYFSKWYVPIYINGDQSETSRYQRMQADIATVLGDKSPSAVNAEIYKRGIEIMHDEHVKGKKDSSDFETLVNQLRLESRKDEDRQNELKILRKYYQQYGSDKFRKHCLAHSIDADAIIDEFSSSIEDDTLRWHEIALEFLYNLLEGKPYEKTDHIRQEAIDAGIISEDLTDWGNLRQLASRRGFTRHGYGQGKWAIPA